MTTPSPGPVAAVVALKPVDRAKSRLAPVPDPLRRRLAWTMALDTLAALAASVDHVLVVSDQPALASRLARAGLSVPVLPESGRTGMNAALAHGGATLRADGFATVLACVGDLPALRPGSVTRVLAAAGVQPRSFVADASGVGTTMLIAHGTALDPHFQGRSAAAHRVSGAVALDAAALGGPVADARRDVDTEVDLLDAVALGLGPATRALIDPETGRPGRLAIVTATRASDPAGVPLAVTAAGRRVRLPAASLDDGIRHVRAGQRLHAVLAGETVLSAWW
ncbi:MAG: cofC [Friedmanniella sp.]|nr:cofC [Friedmanniella sp.]